MRKVKGRKAGASNPPMARPKNSYVGPRGRTEAEARAAHLVKMRGVLECIWHSPPEAACEALLDASFEVRLQEGIDTIRPTRAEMLKLLDESVALIDRISELLQHPTFSGFVVSNSDLENETILQQAQEALSPIRSAALQARNSPQLMKNGKLIRGAGKALLPNEMPAKYVCAAIIAELIEFSKLQGNSQPTQKAAWTGADRLWKSWFRSESWGDDPLTSWKEYFKAADDPKLRRIRQGFHRHLAIRVNRHQ